MVFDEMVSSIDSEVSALKLAEERWQALFEGSADAILITDQEGRIERVNSRAERLFGYPRHELVGKDLEVLLPPSLRERHAQLRGCFSWNGENRPMEGRTNLFGLHRDGHTIPLAIGLSVIESEGSRWAMAIVHDLTAQHAMTEQLRLLGAALESAANGIAITDTQGVCQWINSAFERITGYGRGQIVGQRMSILKSGVHDDAFFKDLWATITAGRPWHGEIHNRHRDGHVHVEEQTIAPVTGRAGEITHFIAVKQDISARKAMEQELTKANDALQDQLLEIEVLQKKLRDQAVHDPLTGLFNRRYLNETLDREVSRSRREGRPLAVVLIDVDHFKRINDTHGHRAGDEALTTIADLLRGNTRAFDTVCRYGGEEFILLLPGASLAAAVERAESLRRLYKTTVAQFNGAKIRTTFSAGVAALPVHGDTGEALIRAADDALYRAKAAGRDRVMAFEGAVGERTFAS